MLTSERLKKLRGLETQKKFSERIGVSAQAVINYEKYGRIPNNRVIRQICERLGVSELWLVNGEGPMYKEQDEKALNIDPINILNDDKNQQRSEFNKNDVFSELDHDQHSSRGDLLPRLLEQYAENAQLIRENGDLRVEIERREGRIRDLEREVEALRKAMKTASVPGADWQGVA